MTEPTVVSRSRHLAVLATVVCAIAAMIFPIEATGAATASPIPSKGSGNGSDSQSVTSPKTRDANRRVDTLTATREEVAHKVASLEEDYQHQQGAVAAAEAEVESANEQVAVAEARVALAENEVELAEISVRQYAVEAYIRPPAQTSMGILAIDSTEDAAYARDVLKIMTEDRRKVVETLTVKKRIAAMESSVAQKAAAEAEAKAQAAHVSLDELEGIRREQQELASQLDDRLDRALAEAAALAEVDQQVADELAAQELELRRSSNLPTASLVSDTGSNAKSNFQTSAVPVTSPPRRPPTTKPGSPTTTRPRATTTTRPKSPTTTVPTSGTGIVGWDDVTNVGGIWVHKSIASNVRGLLNAATAAGLSLSGGGFRDSASQIATRRANCGTSHYDIYLKPASQCTPPTAIPGRSMHEQGKAMDLKSNGVLITSRSNPAFVWLSRNASRFGFYNLPSEPWHWSTNGH